MATADPMTRVDEILKCVICWERFTDPRRLQCGHAFCFECINTHFRTHGKNCAPCPVCRSLYWPDKRDANNLPRSLPLRQLLDIQQIPDRGCEATGCSQDRAIFLCLTCRQWLCDTCKSQTCNDCNTAHNAFIKTDIDPGLFDIVKRSRLQRCCKHNTHDVEWYCPQCRMLVCKLCKTNSHLHHKLVDLTKHSRDTRDSMKRTAASLQEKQQQHRHDLEIYTELHNIVRVELFNASDCQKMMDMCSRDIGNCDKIIQLITQLLKFGSDVVIVDTYRNLEERIETEMGQCHSLEPLLTRLTSRKSDDTDATMTWVGAYHSEQRKHLNSDSGVEDLSVSEGSVEEGLPPEDNPCEIFNCVSSAKAKRLCLTCRKWICDLCSGRRCNQNDSSSTHEVLSVADMDRHLYDVIMRSRNHSCASHPNNEVTLFCTLCNVPVCTTCRVNSHLDHVTTNISDKCQVCCTALKQYKEKLQKQVQDYKTCRHTFLEMQQAPLAEALNPSYCENISSRCESGIDTCQYFIKIITFLRHYGSPPVVVDMFLGLKPQIEDELKACPSDFATPLRQLACYISGTLDQVNICVEDASTYCGDAETQNTGDEAAGGITVTSQGIERNTSSDTVVVSGLESNTSGTPAVNGPESSTSGTPVVNGPESITSGTPLIDGAARNTTVRHRVATSARNAAREMPNNANASEESNARAHMGYLMWVWEGIKRMMRYVSRYLSGC